MSEEQDSKKENLRYPNRILTKIVLLVALQYLRDPSHAIPRQPRKRASIVAAQPDVAGSPPQVSPSALEAFFEHENSSLEKVEIRASINPITEEVPSIPVTTSVEPTSPSELSGLVPINQLPIISAAIYDTRENSPPIPISISAEPTSPSEPSSEAPANQLPILDQAHAAAQPSVIMLTPPVASRPLPRQPLNELALAQVAPEQITFFFAAAHKMRQMPPTDRNNNRRKRDKRESLLLGKAQLSSELFDAVQDQFKSLDIYEGLMSTAKSVGNALEPRLFEQGITELIVVVRKCVKKFPTSLKQKLRASAKSQVDLFPKADI